MRTEVLRERERVSKQMEEEYLRFLDILGAIWKFFFFGYMDDHGFLFSLILWVKFSYGLT